MPEKHTRKARHKLLREKGEWKAKRSEDQPEPAERGTGTRYMPKRAQWEHAALKMARHGDPARLIAKRLGVSVDDVRRAVDA